MDDLNSGGRRVAEAFVAGMESRAGDLPRYWRPRVSARLMPGHAHQIHEVRLDDRPISVTAFEVVSRPGKPTLVRLEFMPESIDLVTDPKPEEKPS